MALEFNALTPPFDKVSDIDTIDELTDVDTTGVSDLDFLQYQTDTWVDFDLFGTANTWSVEQTFTAGIQLNDSDNLTLGTGDDLTFDHDGTNNVMTLANGSLLIDNTANQIALIIQGHSTQSTDPFTIEQSDGTDVFTVDDDGNTTIGTGIAADSIIEFDDTGVLAYTVGFDDSATEFKITSGPMDASNDEIRIAPDQIGFFNTTPASQPSHIADATDAADVITRVNLILADLATLGLQAAS